MKLRGVSAIVTGANQGLGLEIARAFVAEGAHVALCARDGDKLRQAADTLRACGPTDLKVFFATCDVSQAAEVAEFVEAASDAIGPIGVLVNNAGVLGPKGPSEEVDFEEWKRAFEINVFGPMLLCRALVPRFKAQKQGRIINLSGGGATAPQPFISGYAASKAALVRLTETLAEELRDYGVTVNAVAPGALNTRLLNEVLSAGPAKVGEAYYRKTLLQSETTSASLSQATGLCVWLASAASLAITGRLISAKWDRWEELAQHSAALGRSDIYTLRRIIPEDRGLKWN
jgi:NAD(P)-dependent dehydrogenase (short-subunit alcohol dehydrogenase family)